MPRHSIPVMRPVEEPRVVDLAKVHDDEDSEWEYEYSTTETESHFVTVDLSIPEFLPRADDHALNHRHIFHTRGGFRESLPKHTAGRHGRASKPVGYETQMEDDDDESQPPPAAEEDNSDGNADDDPVATASKSFPLGSEGAARSPGDEEAPPTNPKLEERSIQILNFHSSKPIISYRGRVFSGAWQETIGTELLFAPHNAKDARAPLLRLDGTHDLLGASAVRIACTPAELRPRQAAAQADRLKRARADEHLAVIAIGDDATGARQLQATFLENLMAVKRARGEGDTVTVRAVDSALNHVIGDDAELAWRRKRERDSARGAQRLELRRLERGRAGRGRGRGRPRGWRKGGYSGTVGERGQGGSGGGAVAVEYAEVEGGDDGESGYDDEDEEGDEDGDEGGEEDGDQDPDEEADDDGDEEAGGDSDEEADEDDEDDGGEDDDEDDDEDVDEEDEDLDEDVDVDMSDADR